MSTFTLTIFCLITSNLPWFMDLTFQVLMQFCSLEHHTLLSPPDTSTTGHCFHFGSASSFLLELFLCSSPVVYWAPTNLRCSSSSVICFCFFILFMRFCDINHSNVFLDQSRKAKEIKATFSFCPTKETINKMKRQSTKGENMCNVADKGLMLKIHKQLIQLNIKMKQKPKLPNQKMDKRPK